MKRLGVLSAVVVAGLCAASAGPARAGSHLWVVNEIFSSADGTVQFIEMHVPSSAANETQISTRWVRSTATSSQFDFTQNLPSGSTAFAYLLLGTQAFANLPGAPTPDHIIPSGFIDLSQDDLEYWLYATGDLAFGPGQLPLDGITSLNRDLSTGVNSPTNFAGESGSIDLTAVAAPEIASAGEPALRLQVVGVGSASFQIEFELPRRSAARVVVHDVSGRIVRRLFDQTADGVVRIAWDGSDATGRAVGSGVYFVTLDAAGQTLTDKVTVVR